MCVCARHVLLLALYLSSESSRDAFYFFCLCEKGNIKEASQYMHHKKED